MFRRRVCRGGGGGGDATSMNFGIVTRMPFSELVIKKKVDECANMYTLNRSESALIFVILILMIVSLMIVMLIVFR